MKKKIILFLAFLIPVLVFAFTYDWEIDYMEYANDTAAQAAYVSNDTQTESVLIEQTTDEAVSYIGDSSSTEWRGCQSFTLSSTTTISKIAVYFRAKTGTPSGSVTVKIETDSSGDPSGTLAHANATKVITPSDTAWNDVDYTNFELAAGTYWIRLYCDDQATDNRWNISQNLTPDLYDGGVFKYSQDGGSSWAGVATRDMVFRVYALIDNLQSYSESTIKQQGTYSLKGVAVITDSLSDTLTRTIGDNLDLSNCTGIEYDIYASRTGSNIKIGIHDSGGTTSEHTANVASSNVNQTESWDISGVSDANKDDIDSIIVTIMNADAANTFYLDDLKAGITPAAGGNYTFVQ